MRPPKIFSVSEDESFRTAAALEILHSYSLIHDDLPSMDNDDLRRGKPTCHKKFDEATAILAGDGLLTYAFELLSHPDTAKSAEIRCRLVSMLAKAAGALTEWSPDKCWISTVSAAMPTTIWKKSSVILKK
ncbi:MAG: polyprenyl synthetase family protein [Alphaproteobacteria bacterium]